MKKLDVYILKKFLGAFIFVMSILIFIIVIIDFTEKNDNFIKNDVSSDEILRYFLTYIPPVSYTHLTLPTIYSV